MPGIIVNRLQLGFPICTEITNNGRAAKEKHKVVKRTSINKNILFEIYNNINWRRLETVISKCTLCLLSDIVVCYMTGENPVS